MIPHFILQKGKQEYLIIRMGDEFHIIDCSEALTKEKRNAILESGCTPSEMQEMGLSGTTIPRGDISVITVTGCGFQDDVIFYLGKRKKLAYWFPKAYEQKKVDDFFRGIPRKQYKTRRRIKGNKKLDWRAREQNPDLLGNMRTTGWIWTALCVAVCIGSLVDRKLIDLWFLAAMVLGLAAVFLNSAYDLYFTLVVEKKSIYREGVGETFPLTYGVVLLAFRFAWAYMNRYHILHWFQVVPVGIVFAVLGSLLLYMLCREFRERWDYLLAAFLFCGFMGICVLIPHINHVLGGELEPYTAPVVRKTINDYSDSKQDAYFLKLQFPDGEQLTIQVTKKEYDSYEIGDTMDLQIGTGFFGIEYAIDG